MAFKTGTFAKWLINLDILFPFRKVEKISSQICSNRRKKIMKKKKKKMFLLGSSANHERTATRWPFEI